jgi:hypothetical protein
MAVTKYEDYELILVSGDKFRIFKSDKIEMIRVTQVKDECIGINYIPNMKLFISSENCEKS